MLVLCSNVTVSVKKFTCASVRREWSLDQLGRHISIVILLLLIIILILWFKAVYNPLSSVFSMQQPLYYYY